MVKLSKRFSLPESVTERWGVDTRALGLLRIGAGALVLIDLLYRAQSLRAHYTDAGVLPRSLWLKYYSGSLDHSFHIFSGSAASQALLFFIAGIFAFMLLIGYRTRSAAFMSWLFLTSLHMRTPHVLQSGDELLRLMIFWSMFTPIASRFSVDAVISRASPPPKRILHIGVVALIAQLFIMYIATAVLKAGPTWHSAGTALFRALHHQAFVTPLGALFAQAPNWLLYFLTRATWAVELVGVGLFFIPARTHLTRTLMVFIFWGFHLSLILLMNLGHFPWIAILYWTLLLPSWFFDGFLPKFTLFKRLRAAFLRTGVVCAEWIEGHRRWFYGGAGCATPKTGLSFVSFLLCALLAGYASYGAAFNMLSRGKMIEDHFDGLYALKIHASWSMFAPNPPATSGWFVIVGETAAGEKINLWDEGLPVSWERPENISESFRSQRWRKYFDNMTGKNSGPQRLDFLLWVCRDWRERRPEDRVELAQMFYMNQTVNYPEKGWGPLEKNSVSYIRCP